VKEKPPPPWDWVSFKPIGKKAIIALREPSLGPSFGIKAERRAGLCPGSPHGRHQSAFLRGYPCSTTAHNLLAAMLDNHLHQGNWLNIDPRQVVFRRVMDLNERALRNIVLGLGGKINGYRVNRF
jgi:formate--tetrahydrofolate ligase